MKTKSYYILSFIILFFISCNNDTKNTDSNNNTVYLGGNIINKNCDEVKLIKLANYDNTDTLFAKIDSNNFFLFKLDSLEPGMYTFIHDKEFQHIYLDKHDSLMLRVNTLEFDESLVFTGKGATENNYLINRFLHNEKHDINLLQLYALDKDDFIHNIDSTKAVEEKLLKKYNYEGSDFSKNALVYIKRMLDFTEYKFKEYYVYNNTLINKKHTFTEVDSTFYDFRKKINLKDTTLYNNQYFEAYINARISNLTLDSIIKVIPVEDFLENSYKYTKIYHKIHAHFITSNVKNQSIKNYLFYRYTLGLFDGELTVEELNDLLIPFYQNVTDDYLIDHVNKSFERYKNLRPGSKTPDFEVFDGKKHKLFSSYFGKPIYLFFWLNPNRYTYNKDYTKKYNQLKKEFPNIQFISIYLDYPNTWESSLESNGANGIQLLADYEIVKEKYLIPFSNSFLLIDKQGNIVDANANWPGSKNIIKHLKKLK